MTPYLSIRYTIHRPDGLSVITLALEDDQPGLVRIADEETSILVNIDEIPALILALQEVMRENERVEREMKSGPADTADEPGAPATTR